MTKLFSRLPRPNQGIIGHRGAAGLAPENTISAFKKAAELKLNWIEFDVQCCQSGEWVFFHDPSLNRTTNGSGQVSDTPLDIIQKLDAGSWFDPKFKAERVPLLKEVLNCALELKLHPNIEIKRFGKEDKAPNIQSFLEQLRLYWPQTLPPPLVSSFDLSILTQLRELSATLPLGYNIENDPKNSVTIALKNKFDSLHVSKIHANKELFDLANKYLLPICVFTVNDPEQIQTLLKNGASAVFSDLTYYDFSKL